jgi:carboxyl-terminal processing protease
VANEVIPVFIWGELGKVKNFLAGKPEAGRGRLVRRTLLVLLLLALAIKPGLPADTASTSYDSLRLFTEALYEISQKYVYPKSEDEMMDGAIRGMISSLDPTSSFLTPKEYQSLKQGHHENQAEAGVELIIKDNLLTVISVIDGGPAAEARLKPEDRILKINGKIVRNMTTQEATRKFHGAPGTRLKLQVIRIGALKPMDITLTLEPLSGNTVTSQRVGEDYGYVRMRYFNDNTPTELAAALKSLTKGNPSMRGLIIDLRNNARGSMEQAVRSASLLLGDKEIVSAKGRSPGSQETFRGKERDLALKVPLPTVVLVDQGTARAAEIMAGALHDQYQAKLLGAKTLGLCGLTKVLPLLDGSALVMTVSECYTPSGQKIQGKGLEPDIQGKTLKSKGPIAALPQTSTIDQDPWVLQAMEVLKSGNKGQTAPKA